MIGDIYRICLFGHRDFENYRFLDTELYELIKDAIETKEFVEIYIGRNGEFDIYAASVVKRAQRDKKCGNSEFVCVLPYYNKNIDFYSKYYDDVIIPETVEALHPKQAITKRNCWMVEMCDLVICYVEKTVGGAYQALSYARKLNKNVVNLAHRVLTDMHQS